MERKLMIYRFIKYTAISSIVFLGVFHFLMDIFNLFSGFKELSIWMKMVFVFNMIPILFWPLIAFGSIFIFDNPRNIIWTFVAWIMIICYPIWIVLIQIFALSLQESNKFLSESIFLFLAIILLRLIVGLSKG